MDITNWLAYVSVIAALIAIPGPSSLLITLHGYEYGFKKTNNTIIGNLMGSLVLMGFSAIGLGVILTSSEVIFSIAKYIGASYLIYIGIKTLLKSPAELHVQYQEKFCNVSNYTLLKKGFLTGISNPKDLLFFAALFPAFLSPDGSLTAQLTVLMLTWLFVDYLLKVIYMTVGEKINSQFSSPKFLTLFNRFTGGLFVIFGMILVGSSRS
jgi:homoserine/homoserine lactone efflux protein